MISRSLALLLVALAPILGAELAAYDSDGRIVSLIGASGDFPVSSNLVAVLPNGKRQPLQIRKNTIGAVRRGDALEWSAPFMLPDGGHGRMELNSMEDVSGVHYSASLAAETDLDLSSVELVIDIPRPEFLTGSATADLDKPITIGLKQPPGSIFFSGSTTKLSLQDQPGTRTLDIRFDHPQRIALVDRWDASGRSLQLRVTMKNGEWRSGATAGLTVTLRSTDAIPSPPAHLTVDASKPRYRFQGFGGNYCWDNRSPIAAYTLKNLKLAWARTAMKLVLWDKERDHPGPELVADLELMRRLQQQRMPYVISVWALPERFYVDAYEKPASAHARAIDPLKWDELLDLLVSYLQYAKREYNVQPDLFSFNEANIGINVALTPLAHADAIKRIGLRLQAAGLKTKLLLGDAASPRDTHRFTLEAASDADARPLIGAIAFHSWGGGTPEQYSAWGDLAEWLSLPLMVTEVGVDPSAYYTHSWDSYDYGLREAQMIQELLIHARPQAMLFWQFTDDYALAKILPDGSVRPTARYWILKHFTDLPRDSDALTATSDQANVSFTAFRSGDDYTLQILNSGAARDITVTGLPDGALRMIETTETAPDQPAQMVRSESGRLEMNTPSRSLVTLVGSIKPVLN